MSAKTHSNKLTATMARLELWTNWILSDDYDPKMPILILEDTSELLQFDNVGGNEDLNTSRVPGR